MGGEFDYIVVGQGLAGTAVSWWLRWSGMRVFTVDRSEVSTPSRIAAGLITPVTGKKLVQSWRYHELWDAAEAFYRRVERETGTNFLVERPMVRLFSGDADAAAFASRFSRGEYSAPIVTPVPDWNRNWFGVPADGFQVNSGGQLSVSKYLDASRICFQKMGGFRVVDLDVSRETELLTDRVRIPKLGIEAGGIVFCEGTGVSCNPWFHHVRLKPAKGEILTLKIPDLHEHRVIHRGIWITPDSDGLFRAGATYDWKELNQVPTAAGRNQILAELALFLNMPFEVVDHCAAVRPIHRNQFPILGRHPVHRRLSIFNGLGSKGSLQAPHFAMQLVNHLLTDHKLDREVDLSRKPDSDPVRSQSSQHRVDESARAFHVKRRQSIPLTQQAQDAIGEVLHSGDFAIDATAGNGHDTVYLSRQVGPLGNVLAIDIQDIALVNTSKRLADAGLGNVTLVRRNHADLDDLVPTQQQYSVAAVMFNLGYLPGGDKEIKTRSQESCLAIRKAAKMLRPGGVLTILAYTGHDGGEAEAERIAETLRQLSERSYNTRTIESQPGRASGPVLFLVKRL